jgi:hypothetical protein
MPTYNSRCPQCNTIFEYSCKISEMESMRPHCSTCKDPQGEPVKTGYSPVQNVGKGFQTVGPGWFGHSSRGDKKGY